MDASFVLAVANQIAVAGVNPEAAGVLAPRIEMHVKRLLQEAIKYQQRMKAPKLTVDHLNMALAQRDDEPIYGLSSTTSMHDANKSVTIKSRDVKLADLCGQRLPRCPIQCQVNLHWLAIDGLQPSIPENPALQKKTQSQEIVQALGSGELLRHGTAHVLPREMQIFFSKVIESLISNDESKISQALTTVAHEAGLQELVPYFTRYIYAEVKENTRNLELLHKVMLLVESLFANREVRLEPYLHQVLPAALTCVVGGQLCRTGDENHWALRRHAASIVSRLVRRYKDQFPDLEPRVIRTYLDAIMNTSRSFRSVFGALVGTHALGIAVFHASLVPNVSILLDRFESAQLAFDSTIAAGSLAGDSNEQLITVEEVKQDDDVSEEVEDDDGNVRVKVKPKFVIKAPQNKKADAAVRMTRDQLSEHDQEKRDLQHCRMTFVHIIGSYWQHKLQSMGRPAPSSSKNGAANGKVATHRRRNRFQTQPADQVLQQADPEAKAQRAPVQKSAAQLQDDELYRRLEPFAEELVPYIVRGTYSGYSTLLV